MRTNRKIAFLFPGQGSQYRNMGITLFESNEIFRQSLAKSDATAKRYLNLSLIQELYFGSDASFDNLCVTNPAIVAVEIAVLRVLEHCGVKPDFVSGFSIGEFAAAVASGVWSDEEALVASIIQSQSIKNSGVFGGMMAIVNQPKERWEKYYREIGLYLASDNFDGHFTLSGSADNLRILQSELEAVKAQFFRLPVNHPFHSPLILEALNEFNEYMDAVDSLSNPRSGHISSIACNEVEVLSRDYFSAAVSSYANFLHLVKFLENRGPCVYVDLGPSGTSANFVKYNLSSSSKSEVIPIVTPFKQELRQIEYLAQMAC